MITEAQEAILAQMIAAYQNGKRLSDLPEAHGVNPFDLYTEVLEDGESKKAALAKMLPYMESQCAYGVEFDTTVSTPACTRIGNMDLHKSLPIQSRMRGCILNDNGGVVEYLNPLDWTGQVRDGSRGQVMVEIPIHYVRFVTDGTKRRVMMSEYPLPGYTCIPTRYVSAYEATVDRSSGNSSTYKLASVVNMEPTFRGGSGHADWDGTFRTLLGRPATGISRTNFRNYARNRNAADEKKQWNCMTYGMQKDIYWLFVVEYATLNTQAAYNAELTADGYRQGGLGAGVSTVGSAIAPGEEHTGEATESWIDFNGYNPFVPCGHTDHLGNGTGQVEYAVQDDTTGAWEDQMVPRYRGIENPFGHIWQWTDGINVRISPTEENGGDGLSMVFVCDNPVDFKDSGYDGYSYVGNEARAEGYVKQLIFGEGGEIMPELVGGGSTTYHCDYHSTNIPTAESLRGVLFGGAAHRGACDGLVCAHSTRVPSYTDSNIGSRLCFYPA